MEIVDVRNILLEDNRIASVVCYKDRTYMQHSYSVFVSCELIVSGQNIPIYIGIPNRWTMELVDFYIEDYKEFPYMPHIDTRGKICLYELEGVLIDADIEGILKQCIQKAISIISEGLEGINKSDFIDEFSSYWCQFPGIRCVNCNIPATQKTQLIKYVENTVKRGKKEKYASYIERSKRTHIFAACNSKAFDLWSISGSQRNGAYIYINPMKYIYPPDARRELDVAYINELLLCVPKEDADSVLSKMKSTKLLIFCIVQPSGIENYMGVFLKNVNIQVEGDCYQIRKTDSTEICPLSIHRIDKKYLMKRVDSDRNTFSEFKWLVVGCGSIGGYLVNELINAGADRITLVDSDKLQNENIYRHLLGIEYVGQYKAEALAQYFGRNMPEVKITPYDEDICNLLEEESIQLNEFDIIISATGNHNVNRWINAKVQQMKYGNPVIYVWNEPLDLGCHVAVITSENKGCYECFFDRNSENEELFDKVAYCAPGQNITKNITGCGNAFVPYASTVSLKSTALCMDTLSEVVDGRRKKNVIVSMKGAGYYFTKTGYKVSERYTNQKDVVMVQEGKLFANENCEVCG
ncbi:MAG: ThiF family adenylyltransferase [Lachnospiraceae bacterium]|nr:ThiF family adenylyltransferase [Lachnospiraceae bacterium]